MTERYLVVSGDSHAGPSLSGQLREYCPRDRLEQFDDFARMMAAAPSVRDDPTRTPAGREALARTKACAGQQDPHAHLADMDADGIAAEVIFAGGQNDETLPWGASFGAQSVEFPTELHALGSHIWNQWLADFVSVAPERLVGVMQIPIFDVDAAVREIRWGREHGLRAVNFPAPRADFSSYTDDVYEPLWSVCEELDVPLLTHNGAGERALGVDGRAGVMLTLAELHFMSRRNLWQLVFGGVFERHPGLRLVFTEQGVAWVRDAIRELDSIWECPQRNYPDRPAQRPSEYWATNCFVCGSFLAPYETAVRDEVGLGNLVWGSDYPHSEGTWPNTRLALRHAFAGVPTEDVRTILGDNGVRIYGLDEAALRPIADRIGPTPEELSVPLAPEEFPAYRGLAFREFSEYS